MRRMLIQLTIAAVTFYAGVSAVSYFWDPLTARSQPTEDAQQIDAPAAPERFVAAAPQLPAFYSTPARTERRIKSRSSPIPIDEYEGFEEVVAHLKKLPAFMKRGGKQTFYISAVQDCEDSQCAYAYWKEYDALIVLNLPFYGEPTDSDLFWLSGKAYTNLNEDVVPKELNNMGCCLVTKAWADKAVKACKAGYKLKFNVKVNDGSND